MAAVEAAGTTVRAFERLPIDVTRGFPQTFSFLFDGTAYDFRLYVNLPAEALAADVEFFDLPTAGGHLVAEVSRDDGAGGRERLMLRKVVPGVVYVAGPIALEFPRQLVARDNLNGEGDKGSRVDGR